MIRISGTFSRATTSKIMILIMTMMLLVRFEAVNLLLCLRDAHDPVLELSVSSVCPCPNEKPGLIMLGLNPEHESSGGHHDDSAQWMVQEFGDECLDLLLAYPFPLTLCGTRGISLPGSGSANGFLGSLTDISGSLWDKYLFDMVFDGDDFFCNIHFRQFQSIYQCHWLSSVNLFLQNASFMSALNLSSIVSQISSDDLPVWLENRVGGTILLI
ncbi:MAG: hypothetical protein CVV64_13335 [Candidatus Wallbacteria bacterium HGW-Wallbacteria-1]|jgi:hypothetical protein|uniref:Uncharacterized protein n=1 Tax=Candidatus Wallbacteria bacterium HGW-Wallbacteria-1 TaxID=2013854 RepID=A0A2N1PMU6_9BACT|nr:MAG: hypothetical protein CVV64_13335 [Candidatus Wallbacteria bacterium HGW-Wallbacteria-1]